jgi:hypothetical protein
MRPIAIARLLFFILMLSTLSMTARAQCITYNGEECLLPPSCLFPVIAGNSVIYGSNSILNFTLGDETPCLPYPPVGTSADDTFDAHMSVRLSSDGGNTFPFYVGMAHMIARYTTVSDNGVNRNIDAEILSMDLSSPTFPAGLLIRESPTLASTGPLASEIVQGGGRALHAHINLYTEMSVDNGQTWTPANAPLLMIYYESTPVKEASWGSLKAIYR